MYIYLDINLTGFNGTFSVNVSFANKNDTILFSKSHSFCLYKLLPYIFPICFRNIDQIKFVVLTVLICYHNFQIVSKDFFSLIITNANFIFVC